MGVIMKKVLLINASNRRKNTYKLLSSIEEILKNKGYETELISLSNYKIDFCKGCEACILKGDCFLKDESKIVMEKIIESDGLVIGTPVYLNNMSGILKTFIDRTCSWFHRSEVAQKPTLLLANTQGSGLKNTINSIEEAMIQPVDKEYWINKGWIHNAYFPGTKINPIKKLYGNGLYKLLTKVIKPIEQE